MTNKQVQAILRDFRGRNPLYRRVINEIVRDSRDCCGSNLHERIISRLKYISCGLSTGIVSSMINCKDTVHFFNLYKKYIANMLTDLQYTTGKSWTDFIRDFDTDDLLIRDTHNKNLLAWFAYEMIASHLEGELN